MTMMPNDAFIYYDKLATEFAKEHNVSIYFDFNPAKYGYTIVMKSHQFYVSREISDIILRNLKEPFKTFNNLLLDMLEELIKGSNE